jgi:hypothetical protein
MSLHIVYATEINDHWPAFVEDFYHSEKIARAVFVVSTHEVAHMIATTLAQHDHNAHVFDDSVFMDECVSMKRVWILPYSVWKANSNIIEEDLLPHQNALFTFGLGPMQNQDILLWLDDAHRRGFGSTTGWTQWWLPLCEAK